MYDYNVKVYAQEIQVTYYEYGIGTTIKGDEYVDTSGKKDDDNEQLLKNNDKTNKVRSTRRSKQTIYDIARANVWDYFATFTFIEDRYDYEICKSRLSKWFNNFKNRYVHDFEYLAVPEQHKDGAWHFHALIKGDLNGELSAGFNKDRYSLTRYSLGICEVERVKDANRVAMYITKYITKDLLNSVKDKRRFIYSRGCNKPDVYKVDSGYMQLYDFLKQDIFKDYEIAYSNKSETKGFKTHYIQLKKKDLKLAF